MSEDESKEVKDIKIKRAAKDKENPYVMINKKPLENINLSWKAKGLLSYILSLPDDWELHVSHLIKQSTDGRDSTKSGIQELVNNNYMQRYPIYVNGKVSGYEYEVTEVPYTDEEKIKCIKIINGAQVIVYYTRDEINLKKKKIIDSKKKLSEKNNPYKKGTLTIEKTNGKLKTEKPLAGFPLTENLLTENQETENPTLLINNPTNKLDILNTDSTNQSFNLSNKDKTGSKVIEGRTEDELKEYYQSMEIDKLKADADDVNVLKEAISVLYYSKEIKIRDAVYPASIIKSRLSKLNSLHLQYALDCFNKATRNTEIKNPLMYLCSTIFNSVSNLNLDYQAKANFDLNN